MNDPDKTRILDDDADRTRLISAATDMDRTVRTAARKALTLTAATGSTYGLNSEFTREHVLFEIHTTGLDLSLTGIPGAGGPSYRLPLNIALVIDRSGSMEGEPLDFVKRACGHVVDLLEPNDILSIVTFEEQAEVIMPARRVVNKPLVKEYINRIVAGNTTNLYDGLVQGCQQVALVKSESTLNRVLLLTDGEPTAGTRDFAGILGQVTEQKARGITVTSLCFGPDYNEELMTAVARRSGGNFYNIARPDLIPEVFRRELATLMRITARNLRLRVHMPRGVALRQVYGQQPVLGNHTAEVTLIDVERDTGVTSLWEFEIGPRQPGSYRIAAAELLYDDSATGRFEKLSADAVMSFTGNRALVEEGVNRRVKNEVELAQAARALDRTIVSARTMQIDRTMVMQELNQTKTLLLNRGLLQQAGEITQAMTEIQGGGSVEKTLMGTVYQIDQGKIQ